MTGPWPPALLYPGDGGEDETLQEIGRTTVLGRVARPEEIAEAVLFLATSRASYITGTVLQAHGGQLAIG
ncbi:SDR family oxidoreductase [Streptomyces sp. NPDC051219]|uniref:SDR family oxidoreductase n=1 Tax=Streptomyces sp. NPDC051219 TaxID=3155283 RepID=UPI00343225EC